MKAARLFPNIRHYWYANGILNALEDNSIIKPVISGRYSARCHSGGTTIMKRDAESLAEIDRSSVVISKVFIRFPG